MSSGELRRQAADEGVALSSLDGVIEVDADVAKDMARRSAREEGVLVGISSGASLAAVAQLIPSVKDGARILAFSYDTGERYLSIDALFGTGG